MKKVRPGVVCTGIALVLLVEAIEMATSRCDEVVVEVDARRQHAGKAFSDLICQATSTSAIIFHSYK